MRSNRERPEEAPSREISGHCADPIVLASAQPMDIPTACSARILSSVRDQGCRADE